MTRKRWLWVVGATGAVGAGCIGVVFYLGTTSGITKENGRRLKAGMEKSEVRGILGGQPFDTNRNEDRWIGYEGCMTLTYDEHGKLVWRHWEDLPHRTRFSESIFHPIQWPID